MVLLLLHGCGAAMRSGNPTGLLATIRHGFLARSCLAQPGIFVQLKGKQDTHMFCVSLFLTYTVLRPLAKMRFFQAVDGGLVGQSILKAPHCGNVQRRCSVCPFSVLGALLSLAQEVAASGV